jgi:hypothetical protein
MHASAKLVLAAASGLLTFSASTAAHADQVIDPFTTEFAGKNYFSFSPGPYLWAGHLGTTSASQTTTGNQSISVAGGSRTRVATVAETTLTGTVAAFVLDGDLDYFTSSGPSGILTLEYGPRSASPEDLNLDLSGDGATAFGLTVTGDMYSGPRPVYLTITARSGTIQKSFLWKIIYDGDYQFAFTNLTIQGINMHDVDYLKFQFDASAVSNVDYTLLGGLRTVGSPS